MCSIADLNSDFSQKEESRRAKIDSRPPGDLYPILNVHADTSDSKATIQQIVNEAVLQISYTDSDDSDEYDMYRCMATRTLKQQGFKASSRAVRKATEELIKSKTRIPYVREEDEKDVLRAGWECIFGHQASKDKPCPWNYCQIGGCSKGESCLYGHHQKRKSTICEPAKTGSCRKGVHCAFRHPNDRYEVWFRKKKSRLARLYLWQDSVSPFSRFSGN